MSGSALKWVSSAQNETNLGLFKTGFRTFCLGDQNRLNLNWKKIPGFIFFRSDSVHYTSTGQNVRKLILKCSIFVPFGANLTPVGARPDFRSTLFLSAPPAGSLVLMRISWRWRHVWRCAGSWDRKRPCFSSRGQHSCLATWRLVYILRY